MHDLINLLQVIGGFVGAFATALAVTHKTNKADYEAIIKELRKEKEEFREYYHIERDQRIARDKIIEELKIENNNLKEKINKLKKHQSNNN